MKQRKGRSVNRSYEGASLLVNRPGSAYGPEPDHDRDPSRIMNDPALV